MRFFALGLALAVACHGSDNNTTTDAGSASPDGSIGPDAELTDPVTFMYTPGWGGVNSVEVIGGFGMGSGIDWVAPFATLSEGSNGTWIGSANLPAGTYPYLFKVVGDNQAGSGSATYARYSLDGTISEFEACPTGSPTAGKDPNPCSLLTVPQTAETMFTVKGDVTLDGSGAAKYLVVLERDESTSHHYFVNRKQSSSTGAFSFNVPAGTYRVQVQWPDYESMKDSQVDPKTADVVRRTISGAFDLEASVALTNADVTPPDYAMFAPTGSNTLPTTFTFPAIATTRLDVYGPGAEIGDPWFTSTATGSGSAAFDGTFNTAQAGSSSVDPSDDYSWGTEWAQTGSGGTGSGSAVKWTAQSLVYPVSWPN
jgi:hypothetical protein